MTRQQKLDEIFLFTGHEYNGLQVFPLSKNRRTFLRKMGNSICEGEGHELDEFDELAECLLACTLTPQDLSRLTDKKAWREKLEEFTIASPDYAIERFGNVMMEEVENLKMASVESLGKGEAQ